MSKYLELKAQIEQLEAQLEPTRREELEIEIMDIKKRIVAFGIQPHELFPDLKVDKRRGPRKNKGNVTPLRA